MGVGERGRGGPPRRWEDGGGCGILDVGAKCNVDSMDQVCLEVLQRTSFIEKQASGHGSSAKVTLSLHVTLLWPITSRLL